MRYQFGDYLLDTEQQSLNTLDGRNVELRPHAFDVLRLLVEQAPRVLSKDQILDSVWGHNSLSVSSLPQVIRELRVALKDDATQAKFIRTKPRRGYQFVAEVVAQSERRTSDAPEHSADPEAERASQGLATRNNKGPWLWAAGLLLFVAALVWFGFDRQPAPAPETPRASVAILDLNNLSGEAGQAWLALAIADMLGQRLQADGAVRLAPGQLVARNQLSAEGERTDGLAPEVLARAGELFQVDYIIHGSFFPVGGTRESAIQATLRLQRVSTGEILLATQAVTLTGRLDQLSRQLGDEVRVALGLSPLSVQAIEIAEREFPKTVAGQRAYAEGLQALHNFDTQSAIQYLLQAREAEPESVIINAQLAEAYLVSGDYNRASDQHQLAQSKAAGAPQRTQLTLAALGARIEGQFDVAVDAFKALSAFYPDDREYAYELLIAQLDARQIEAAEQTLQRLMQVGLFNMDDPRWLLAQARVFEHSDQPNEQKIAAKQALERTTALDAPALEAAATLQLATALEALGEFDEALEVLDDARRRFERIGDRLGVGETLLRTASILSVDAEIEASETWLLRADQLYQAIENPSGQAKVLQQRAMNALHKGQNRQAISYFQRALAVYSKTGQDFDLGPVFDGLALAQQRVNDLEAAFQSHEQAYSNYLRSSDLRGQARSLNSLGLLLGGIANRLAEAERYFESALEIFRQLGDKRGQATVLGNLGAVADGLGQAERRGELAAQSIELFIELGDKRGAARLTYNVGASARDGGDFLQAVNHFADAANLFAEVGFGAGEVAALSELANWLVPQGLMDKASQALQRGESIDTDNLMMLARLNTARGRWHLTRGEVTDATSFFETAKAQRAKSPAWARMSELDLARVALVEKRFTRAEQMAETVARQCQEDGEHQDEAEARLVVAAALIEKGQASKAVEEVARARTALENHANQFLEWRATLMTARIEGGTAGVERLQWLSEQARVAGLDGFALEVELWGGYLTAEDDPDAGIESLRLVLREADERGLFLLSEKATERIEQINSRAGPAG